MVDRKEAMAALFSISVHAALLFVGADQWAKLNNVTKGSLTVSIAVNEPLVTEQSLQSMTTQQHQPTNTELVPEPKLEPQRIAEPQLDVKPKTENVSNIAKANPTPVNSTNLAELIEDAQQNILDSQLVDNESASGSNNTALLTPDFTALPLYHLIPKPIYPKRSRDLGEEGTVIILILVSDDGSVREATVFRSSGHSLLDGSALSTVKTRWRFKPAKRNGNPITSEVRVPINFSIK